MAPHYQATTLIASPSYPNAITWSSENLVAVASGHIVTILNPAALDGPRGLVVLVPSNPFPIGAVNREDLFEPCLVPTCLSRDTEPCARSVSWSQQGFAPNSGCLLAVCSGDGRVNLYRPPIFEFGDNWVKVADISQLLFNYYQIINFREDDGPISFPQEAANNEQAPQEKLNSEHGQDTGYAGELQEPLSCKVLGRRKRKPTRVESYVYDEDEDGVGASKDADFSPNPCSRLSKGFMKKVTTNSSAPVSSISLSAPAQPQDEVNLAIGRVSGSLETWKLDLCNNKIENSSACHAHDRVDNSARCWILEKNQLEEVPVYTNFPELKESTDLSVVSDRCFGLTLAPGELIIAVVRSLDPNMLDPMYQARTQKAVVEFIWIGGQFLGIALHKNIHISSQQSVMLSETNFLWWGSNILWSLKKYEKGETGLVLWDVIATLQVLKKSSPIFLETLLHNWVSDLFSDDQQRVSLDILYQSRNDMMSKVSSRKLHLLNIICRKVMLSDNAQYSPGGENSTSVSTDLWNNLLVSSERELRERLVAFTFAAVLNRLSYFQKGTCAENMWFPVGVAQMYSWLSMNNGKVHNQLKSLCSTIKGLQSRIASVCEYSVEESCTYCSASVHFESPDVALCGSGDPVTSPAERHKLSRCMASMRLSSVLQPVWYCVCCEGMVDKLVPGTFFTMTTSPLQVNHDDELLYSAPVVPLCPFCGILLQRLMPEFLLSVSPV
ncbi:hypothetical protein ACQ4PT_001982 [Festuca glaucescens]